MILIENGRRLPSAVADPPTPALCRQMDIPTLAYDADEFHLHDWCVAHLPPDSADRRGNNLSFWQGEVIDCDGIAYRIIAAKHWNRFTELWGRRA